MSNYRRTRSGSSRFYVLTHVLDGFKRNYAGLDQARINRCRDTLVRAGWGGRDCPIEVVRARSFAEAVQLAGDRHPCFDNHREEPTP